MYSEVARKFQEKEIKKIKDQETKIEQETIDLYLGSEESLEKNTKYRFVAEIDKEEVDDFRLNQPDLDFETWIQNAICWHGALTSFTFIEITTLDENNHEKV